MNLERYKKRQGGAEDCTALRTLQEGGATRAQRCQLPVRSLNCSNMKMHDEADGGSPSKFRGHDLSGATKDTFNSLSLSLSYIYISHTQNTLQHKHDLVDLFNTVIRNILEGYELM